MMKLNQKEEAENVWHKQKYAILTQTFFTESGLQNKDYGEDTEEIEISDNNSFLQLTIKLGKENQEAKSHAEELGSLFYTKQILITI